MPQTASAETTHKVDAPFGYWGRYPIHPAHLIPLHWQQDLPKATSGLHNGVLPVGMGRSYGDSCLLKDGNLLVTAGMNRLLSFDTPSGLLTARAGITLALDVPIKPNFAFRLFERIADMIREFGGRLYPAKDAAMTAAQFQTFYPQWEQLARFRAPLLTSSFWERVTGDKPSL